MPDVHGSHLAQRLVGRYPGLKVLYTHGGIDSGALASDALSAHVRVLKKPFTAATLIPILRRLIDEREDPTL